MRSDGSGGTFRVISPSIEVNSTFMMSGVSETFSIAFLMGFTSVAPLTSLECASLFAQVTIFLVALLPDL